MSATKIIDVPEVAPYRIQREQGERRVSWSVVYPSGKVSGVRWDRKLDAVAIAKASKEWDERKGAAT